MSVFDAALAGVKATIVGFEEAYQDKQVTLKETTDLAFAITEGVLLGLGVWNTVVFQPHQKFVRVGDLVECTKDCVEAVYKHTKVDSIVVLS